MPQIFLAAFNSAESALLELRQTPLGEVAGAIPVAREHFKNDQPHIATKKIQLALEDFDSRARRWQSRVQQEKRTMAKLSYRQRMEMQTAHNVSGTRIETARRMLSKLFEKLEDLDRKTRL